MESPEQTVERMTEAQKEWALSLKERRITEGGDLSAQWDSMPDLYVTIGGKMVFFGGACFVGFRQITETLNRHGQAVRSLLERQQ